MSPARGEHRLSTSERGSAFEILVDGERVLAYPGETIVAALLASGRRVLRWTALRGEPRGVYCAMGVCGECAMVVNGEPGVRACVTVAVPAMRVSRPTGWASGKGPESRVPNDDATPGADVSTAAPPRGEAPGPGGAS